MHAVHRIGSAVGEAHPTFTASPVPRHRGRLWLYELLTVDEAVRRDIAAIAPASRIAATAVEGGMRSLHADGVARALAGITTLEEVARVTM